MKRSEMITKIKDLIIYSDNVDVPNSSYINDQKLAEEILDFIEQEGMLPPTSTCYLIETPRGPKHSAVGHWWDNEDNTPKE